MGKLRQTALILGEGPTEFFYFKSLCDVFKRLTIKPDYPKHTNIKELELKIEEGISMGYNHIFCVIDMDTKDHQQQLYDYVRKLMERDRAKHNVLPLSKFGLMQITRQRVRPAVEVDVMETCPTCMGKGKIQPSILFTDQLAEECEHMSEHFGTGLRLHLHPYVYAYVSRGWFMSLKAQWRRRFGVHVVENQSLGMLEMRFYDAKGNRVELPTPEQQEEEMPKQQNEAPKQEPKKVEQPQPKKAEQKKTEQPKPKTVEQPKQEQPKTENKKAEQPKKKSSKKKASKPQADKQEAPKNAKPQQPVTTNETAVREETNEQPKKAKRSRRAAKPKASPVEPAEKSAAETKAPAAVKRRARKQNAQAVAQKANGESEKKGETH